MNKLVSIVFVARSLALPGQGLADEHELGDTALVVQGNLATYKQKNDGIGGDVFDTNPRMVLILLKNPGGNGFRLAKMTRNIVGCADSPTMDEPFQIVIC
jgi:hypothetical protein